MVQYDIYIETVRPAGRLRSPSRRTRGSDCATVIGQSLLLNIDSTVREAVKSRKVISRTVTRCGVHSVGWLCVQLQNAGLQPAQSVTDRLNSTGEGMTMCRTRTAPLQVRRIFDEYTSGRPPSVAFYCKCTCTHLNLCHLSPRCRCTLYFRGGQTATRHIDFSGSHSKIFIKKNSNMNLCIIYYLIVHKYNLFFYILALPYLLIHFVAR